MLGTGARYAEYGITGGFFLFTTVLILGLIFPPALIYGADILGNLLSATVSKIPPLAQPTIQSLLVALGLLSVFIVGLVLEIMGSFFGVGEAFIFREHLVGNKWIANFVQDEMPDYAEDYILVLDLADRQKRVEAAREQRKKFTLWTPYTRKGWVEAWANRKHWRQENKLLENRFRRLEFGLMANVLTSGAKTEILTEQISICRMSRGIATALVMGAMEMVICAYGLVAVNSYSHSFLFLSIGTLFMLLILVIGSFLLVFCALAITRRAYLRFAYILFSLAYAGWTPQTGHKEVSC